jgi:hypothetical protein
MTRSPADSGAERRRGPSRQSRVGSLNAYEVPEEGQLADASDTPYALRREDLIAALLGATMVVGLYLDGWNHINLQGGRLGSFFTPWHALLYAGFTAAAAWVITRNPHLYLRGRRVKPEFHRVAGIPLRYPFAIVGIAVAFVGVAGDLVWHTVFGEEVGVARVIAPFHLMLFAGGASLVAAAFRSGWHAPRHYPAVISFSEVLPPLLALTLLTALGTFMFQWLSAFMDWRPSLGIDDAAGAPAGVRGTQEMALVARVVVTNMLLLGPILLALRRWRLPFWSVTFVFTTVAVAMTALTNFELWVSIPASAVGGLVADALIAAVRPSPSNPVAYRVIAGTVPLAIWLPYFLGLRIANGVVWPLDLWLGAVGLSTLTGIVLSFLAVPPTIPGGLWVENEDATRVP